MNPDLIDELFDYVEANATLIDGIVVIKNGYIVAESYPSKLYNSEAFLTFSPIDII